MSSAKRSRPRRTVQHVLGDDNNFMQHNHNILLVLIFAVVAVQTKDLNNIILKLDDNVENTALVKNSSASVTITTDITNAISNLTKPANDKQFNEVKPVDDINSTIINIKSIQYSLELPVQTIDINIEEGAGTSENDTDINETNISKVLQRSGSLPTPIVPKRILTIKRTPFGKGHRTGGKGRATAVRAALRLAAIEGLKAVNDLYERREPNLVKRGLFLPNDHPGAKLSAFGAPTDESSNNERGGYAALFVAKKMRNVLKWNKLSRQAPPKISLRRTPLEQFCPPQVPPRCPSFTVRYRTHDGICNNARKPRWGGAHMPFHRYLAPAYNDGIEELRRSVVGGPLPSARFISLLVHGSRESDSPVTLMLAQFGQFIDHDLTLTAQPRPLANGSVIQCCGIRSTDLHPSCAPIKVPIDDPWLGPIGVRCLEFMRSAPAQRPDCLLSWREQTNQVTSYLDGSPIYGSNPRTAEDTRIFNSGLLLFGRGPPRQDACMHGAMANQCIRPGDGRSGEQPGLLAMHHIWVLEHNQIALELAELNPHWSDEKLYQEARRIVGAMIQHITYREFLPLVLGKDVCQLFDLELETSGYFTKYDVKVNPTVANGFSAGAFRFGHALIQSSYMRSTINHQFIDNNVTLHDELAIGDIGGAGSLHRILRGLAMQRAQKRDEFITSELTNHLFQQNTFRFGNDLAAVNIQRGRDHGIPAYTQWREPCGLTPIKDWSDFVKIIGPESTHRIQQGYNHVDDVDLFVGGLAERPVIGGLVGPVFACIIAQQFSNLRKGDRFWYENEGFESSFTPAQLQSIRQVLLSQVICRTLGDGTLQPHVFLPHDISSNERIPCGAGSLTPIDLKPWLERDPFFKNFDKPEATTIRNDDRKDSDTSQQALMQSIVNHVDFPISSLNVGKRPINLNQKVPEPFIVNGTIINNKLDLSMTKRPVGRPVVNKTSHKTGHRVKGPKLPNMNATTKRSVTSGKVPIRRPSTGNRTVVTNTNNKPKKGKQRSHSIQKRDLTNAEKSRGAILVDLDRSNTYTPFNRGHKYSDDKKQVVILTPDESDYEIEINIRPNNKNQKLTTTKPIHVYGNKITTGNRQQFYNAPQSSNLYGSYAAPTDRPGYQDDVTAESSYYGIITKKPYVSINRYSVHENDDTVTTKRPYYQFSNDHTTKRPSISYANHYAGDEIEITTRRPYYHRPTGSQSDFLDTGYGGVSLDAIPASSSNHGGYRPIHDSTTKAPHSSLNDDTYRPYYTVRPQNSNRPSNDDSNYQYRPPLVTHNGHTSYDSPSQSDFQTMKPKPSSAFNYGSQNDPTDRPPILYLDDNWDRTTTKPPQILTYYSVMTTKKNRRTRPTKPINSYQQDSADNGQDEDYFGTTTTTTKRPYIQHDTIDDWNGNPYAQFSQSSNFEYSRQKDVHVFDAQSKASNVEDRSHGLHKDERTTQRGNFTYDSHIDITETDPYWYLRPNYTKYDQQMNMTFNDNDGQNNDSTGLMYYSNVKINKTNRLGQDNKTMTVRDGQKLTRINDSRTERKYFKNENFTSIQNVEEREPKGKPSILVVPLKVLTKPERPDNWVMYHTMEKVPLPQLPELNMNIGSISNEMPRPITLKPDKS